MPKRKPPPQCGTCHAPLLFVAIVRGGPTIAFDKEPLAEGGTVAAYRTAAGAMTGRWLAKGDVPYSHEKRYKPHRCPPPPKPDPPLALFDVDAFGTITRTLT